MKVISWTVQVEQIDFKDLETRKCIYFIYTMSHLARLNENWKKHEIYESENSRHNITVIDWIDRHVVLKTF